MALAASQIGLLFEAQMETPNEARSQLQSKGICSRNCLVDFDEDAMSKISGILRMPGGRAPDPAPGAAQGAAIPAPSFTLGAKSQMRLAAARHLVQCYESAGRDTTVKNICWRTVTKSFNYQWKALVEMKKEAVAKTLKIKKAHESAC